MKKPSSIKRVAVFALKACIALATSLASAQTNVWQDNFESPNVWDNWSVDNGVWEIGSPLTGPATNSAGYRAHEGASCAATVLNGNYPANVSSRLIRATPFVVPPANQNPRLQFWHWYQFSGNSYGVVQIKYGTNLWTDLSPRYYDTSSAVWTRPAVDLSAYAGKAVEIAFRIVADGNVADGWDVDEVSVVKGPYAVDFARGAPENFESGLGDWYAESGSWEVGAPTSGPGAAHSGTNCAATVLGGNYAANTYGRLASPPFVVPTADQNPRLRFWSWYSIGGYDYCEMQIKAGTNAWQLLHEYTSTSSGVWSRQGFDLSAYAGQTVQLGFYFQSGNSGYPYYSTSPSPGWYVDEVVVTTGPLATLQPNVPEGFESGWGDWYVEDGTWEIGTPTSGPPTNAVGLRAHSGTNCAATVLGGNYSANTHGRLDSPPFVVPTADQNPRLRFWSWYNIGGYDYCEMQIKVGTNAWQTLHHYTSNGSGVWSREGFDLSAFAGQTVQLGLYFQSGNSGYPYYSTSPSPGWYVDEVVVTTGPLATLQPNVPEGFESGWGDWYVEDGTWEIGTPTSGPPTNAVGLRTHSGTNCAATVLGGNYAANTYGRLDSPPFVVPTADQNPRLRFWSWYSIGGYDYCEMQIKVGTNAWQTLHHYTSNGSGVWSREGFDLSAYAGRTVQLGFYFQSGNSGYPYYSTSPSPGWYVDEVVVTTGPLATLQPNVPEGFESGWGDWYVEDGTWEIGTPTSGPPTNAVGLRAHSGTNCAATVLGDNYAANTYGRLASPPFVVPTADQNPRLRFWSWYSIGAYDFCEMQIKVGTNAWQALEEYTSTGSGVWSRQGFDLSAYAGQTVQLGFYFQSGNSGYPYYSTSPSPGWYVDEVVVTTGPLATLQPNVPEGFESGWGDWYVEGGTWEIGTPTSGPPTNAVGLRAHSGTNCAATVLSGNYAANTYGRLDSPPFVVPGVGAHPTLSFWHWFSIGSYDSCQLQVKPVGGTWQTLMQYNPGNSTVWSRPSFDLSQYAGQTIQIGFYFQSGNSGYPYYRTSPSPGWYVDEAQITTDTPPTGIVQFTDVRYFVTGGETNATISFERKYGGAGPVEVTFVATDGTASGGVDFDSVVDTISWADGEQGVKTDVVPIHQNCSLRGNRTVTLQLNVPGALASAAAREAAVLVIVDNCLPPLSTSTNIAYLRSLVGTTNWVPTNTSSLFTVEGTVTTYTNLSLVTSDELFYMEDNTNGIAVVFRGGTNQFMPQAGDRLSVTASLTNLNGLLALAPSYANISNVVWRLSAGNVLPTPAALDFTLKTNVAVMEATEAQYVTAPQVWISQAGGAYFPTVMTNLALTNLAGQTFNLTVHPNTDIGGKLKPTGPVTVLGVLTQNDPTAPYTTNYSLMPTRYADIVGGDPGVVQFVTTNVSALKSSPLITLSVNRTGSSNGPVSVGFGTMNGTATAGTDFVATNGVVSWADGEGGPKTFVVLLVNDGVEEPDKTFAVTLTGAALGSNTTAHVLIVNDDFVARPAALTVVQGSNAVFSITPTDSTLACQWWKDGVLQMNGTNVSLTLADVQTNDAGAYWAVVTTTLGSATSSVAILSVLVPPGISSLDMQPTSPVLEGTNVTFCVSATGTAPLSYQWRWNGSDLPGATLACYTMTNAQLGQAGAYSVAVRNQAAQLISADLLLAILPNWQTNTVGTTGDGSCSIANGIFTVNGSGEDIEGTADDFFFVHKPLAGDGQIVARLLGFLPDNPLSEAGVMFRDGTNSGARHVFLALRSAMNHDVLFRRRSVENTYSVDNTGNGTNWAWLRLMRSGDTFAGHASTNGLDWSLVWWTTVANLPTNLEVGLAVTAHRNMAMATAQFDNVVLGPLTPLSGTWPEAGPRMWLPGEPAVCPPFSQFGGLKLLIGGSVGDVYNLQGAPSLDTPAGSWTSVGIVTNIFGVVDFIDPQALTNQSRFYRVQRTSP